jgi:hypothetical protein
MNLEEAVDEFQSLLSDQDELRKQIEDNLVITLLGKSIEGVEITTRYGDHWHKVIMSKQDEITGSMLKIMLRNSAAIHARSLPEEKVRWERMQELSKLIQELND